MSLSSVCINFAYYNKMEIESHPFEPFLPQNAKLLMLGTFPPSPKRWCMEFYYPNFQNDMWRIFGLIFFDDKEHFIKQGENKSSQENKKISRGDKMFSLEDIKSFLNEEGIAIYDTAKRIRRKKGTASDKDLEIVEKSDLDGMLHDLKDCRAVLTAGQLATDVFTEHFGFLAPKKMGEYSEFSFEGRTLRLYRMPSSSRAYPMKIEKKAEYYRSMFEQIFGKTDMQ